MSELWYSSIPISNARFTGVVLPQERPDEILVTLAFNRRLTAAELSSLQLVNSAA